MPTPNQPGVPIAARQASAPVAGLPEGFIQLQKPSFPKSVRLALIATVLFWLVHRRVLPAMPPPETISGFFNLTAIRYKFFDSGPVPYGITFTFLLGLHYLWQIWQKKLLPLSLADNIDQPAVEAARAGDDVKLGTILANKIMQRQVGYYASRFAKLMERWYGDQDIGAVLALKNDILESDEEDVALAFTTISWVEWTLPLLGFFGTVIGIGEAIGSVQRGVRLLFQRGQLDQSVLDLFNAGFKNLALAFDTTFQGLAFLIIVGGLHFLLRRNLALRIAEARLLFRDFVARWRGSGNEPIVLAVGNLDTHIDLLEETVHELRENLRSSDRRATEFREELRSAVERVVTKSPELQWVRKVLFEPVIEFDKVSLGLATKTAGAIAAHLGHGKWKYCTLGLQPRPRQISSPVIIQDPDKGSGIGTASSPERSYEGRPLPTNHRRLAHPFTIRFKDRAHLSRKARPILLGGVHSASRRM